MSSFPPPDVAYEVPQPVNLDDVYVMIVGHIESEPDEEILAHSEGVFYRFCLPKKSRIVRDFWKNIGVTNVSKLPEGAYQDDRGGCGPYSLTGMLVGEDLSDPEEEAAIEEEIPAETEAPDKPFVSRLDLSRFTVEPVEETAVEPEVEPEPIVSVGTKVLMGVVMKSTKPALVVAPPLFTGRA